MTDLEKRIEQDLAWHRGERPWRLRFSFWRHSIGLGLWGWASRRSAGVSLVWFRVGVWTWGVSVYTGRHFWVVGRVSR